jgi:perosamine synthetase
MKDLNNNVPFPMRGNYYDLNDLDSLLKVLNTNENSVKFEVIKKFESIFSNYIGVKNAISLTNATSALHLALKAVGIQPGDEVITTPITWISTSNVILMEKCKPVFADVENDTLNIDINSISERITSKTKAIIPVHYAGHPVDMDGILDLSTDHDLMVIEDAAHAVGSRYKNKMIGSLSSDVTAFSFHSQKILSTLGEGGMATTDNTEIMEKMNILRNHGVKYLHEIDGEAIRKKPWYRDCVDVGYNYRMSEGQAAVGISQIKKIDTFKEKRKELVDQYSNLKINGIKKPVEKSYSDSSWQFYVIKVEEEFGMNRDNLLLELDKRGIGTSVHYTPIYHFAPYKNYYKNDCPIAEDSYNKILSLPLAPWLTKDDIKKVVSEIKQIAL